MGTFEEHFTIYSPEYMREEYLGDLIDGGEIIVKPYSKGRSHGEKLILAEYA